MALEAPAQITEGPQKMPITDERALIEKLLRIEALHAGATTPAPSATALVPMGTKL